MAINRSASEPAGMRLVSLPERRTLRRAEKVGATERKQLGFCTRLGYEFTTNIQRAFRKLQEGLRDAQVWGGPIKEVEGNLGSGVSTYFRVLRWLLKINLLTMILSLGLVVTPGIFMHQGNETYDTLYNKESECTSPDIINASATSQTFADIGNPILQFFTGQGWMEETAMFMGWYPNENITRTVTETDDVTGNVTMTERTIYNFPLAYFLVGLTYFMVSVMYIASNIARLFKKRAVETIDYNSSYSELVLSGWDFNINNMKTAQLKRATLIKSLKEELHNDDQKDATWSLKKTIGVFCVRGITNTVAVGAMAAVVYALALEILQVTQNSGFVALLFIKNFKSKRSPSQI